MRPKGNLPVMHVLGHAGKHALVLSLAGIVLQACALMPNVPTPDPTHPNLQTQSEVQVFEDFSPNEVLAAAEEVLKQHTGKYPYWTVSRKVVRDKSTVVMQYHGYLNIGIGDGEWKEKWVVTAQNARRGTLAIAAYGKDSVGWLFLPFSSFSPSETYPNSRCHINYNIFWGRVRCRLHEEPCPECKELDSAEIMWGGVFWYEPLCGRLGYTPSESK